MSKRSFKPEVKSLLEAASLSNTRARRALLTFLTENHGPFTSEELHFHLSEEEEELDLVTIYRAMATFEKADLVRKCDFGDGLARFELKLEHHHHIICQICKKAESFEQCELTALEKRVIARGYSQITHHLEFFGICSKCQK